MRRFAKTALAMALIGAIATTGITSSSAREGNETQINVCFVPGEDCTQLIVDTIKLAKREIFVQAYGFTSTPILAALAQAKKNGIEVSVILDKSNEKDGYTGATFMANHQIPVLIDYLLAIAHNKVIIIDGSIVVTGSFNFTKSAQSRNAENVVVIVNEEVATRFKYNWIARASLSRPYETKSELTKK